MLSKSLIQFSVDGWSCVPSLLFTWGQTMVEVMKIMVISFKRSQVCTAIVGAPNPGASHHQSKYSLETPGHSQASLLWGHCFFLLGLDAQDSFMPSRSLRGGMRRWWPAAGLGHRVQQCIMGPFEGGHHYLHYLHHSWPQVNSREGTQLYLSTENWIKDLLSTAPPIRTRPSFPLSQSLPSGCFDKSLILFHQRTDRLKTTITEN